MKKRLGIAVQRETMSAAYVRGPALAWINSHDGVVPTPESLNHLMDGCTAPLGCLVTLALGQPYGQRKVLEGLPESKDQRMLSSIVRAAPFRFFLRTMSAVAIPDVVLRKGGVEGAVLDEAVIDTVRQVCDDRGYQLERVTVADAGDSAAAEWAARTERRLAFVISLETGSASMARVVRRSLAILACIVAAASAMLAPTLSARRGAARVRRDIDRLRSESIRGTLASKDLADASAHLDRIGKFVSSRRPTLTLLGDLAQVLPDSTAITAINVDSAGGTLTLLATSATGALVALDAAPSLRTVVLSGALTKEMIGSAMLERLTVRFTLESGR